MTGVFVTIYMMNGKRFFGEERLESGRLCEVIRLAGYQQIAPYPLVGEGVGMRGLWLFWLDNAKQSGWIADIGARYSDVLGYHSTGTDDGSPAYPYRKNGGV